MTLDMRSQIEGIKIGQLVHAGSNWQFQGISERSSEPSIRVKQAHTKSSKYVAISVIEKMANQIQAGEIIDRSKFDELAPSGYKKSRPCAFTITGGILCLLGKCQEINHAGRVAFTK